MGIIVMVINMKTVTVIGYPACSTCKKTIKAFKDHGVEVIFRHVVEDTPTKEELRNFWEKSGLPLKKFFNTSGNVYKEMKLKDQLPMMEVEAQLQLLSDHGMLIKRPIVVYLDQVFVGFNEKNFDNIWA